MLHRRLLLPSALVAVITASSLAQSPPPDLTAMQRRIEQLQRELAELRAAQAPAASAAEVDATVERVMRDAERRSQLLQLHGFTAGWTSERFVLQSENGDYTFRPSLQLQLRHVINTDDGQTDHGFEMKRVKFSIDGNVLSRDLTYFVLWSSGTNGGNLFLEHAWVKYMLGDHWGVRGGQMGNPVIHEQATSSRRQLAVDRSLANVVITGANEAQTQAITALYQGKPLHVEFGYGDGFAAANTDWSTPGDWNAFVRADYVIGGDLKPFADFTARGNKAAALKLGGGLDVTDGPDAVHYRHTADIQYEDAGRLGLYAAYLGRYRENYGGGSTYDLGAIAQAGYMLSDRWELFARGGFSLLDQAIGGEDLFPEFTIGANCYLHGHSAKLTIDLTWLPDGAPADQKGLGILAGDENQFVVRTQFQLLI